jgi:hypothetical protein
MFSPSCPEQRIRDDEKKETSEGRQEVEEVQITHSEVDAYCTAESGAPHDRNNLSQAAIELCTSRHEQEKTPDGAQSAAKARSIMGDKRNQHGRDARQSRNIDSNKSKIRWNEDPGHSKEGNGHTREDQANGADF